MLFLVHLMNYKKQIEGRMVESNNQINFPTFEHCVLHSWVAKYASSFLWCHWFKENDLRRDDKFCKRNLARIQILLFAPFIQFTFKKPCARHFFLIGGGCYIILFWWYYCNLSRAFYIFYILGTWLYSIIFGNSKIKKKHI